jgi:hypothetical protein
MKTISTLANAATLLGSAVVGYTAVKEITKGVKGKSTPVIALGALTLLISYAAFRYSLDKLSDQTPL